MKNLVLISITAFLFASCKDNSAELARLQQQRSIDSMAQVMKLQEAELAHQKTVDSINNVMAMQEAEAKQKSASARSSNSGSRSTQYVQGNAARNEPVAAKKKGWSGAAKGAVIGGGVGIITGAIVDDKKGRGAIIGGLSGAGIGAGTGAILDDAKKKKTTK